MISVELLIFIEEGEKMFVTETITIDANDINKISLEDLIILRRKYISEYSRHSDILHKLITLKKLSIYLKNHQNTRLYTIPVGQLMNKIRKECLAISDYMNKDLIMYRDFQEFIRNFRIPDTSIDEYKTLFCIDRAIEKIERSLNEQPSNSSESGEI